MDFKYTWKARVTHFILFMTFLIFTNSCFEQVLVLLRVQCPHRSHSCIVLRGPHPRCPSPISQDTHLGTSDSRPPQTRSGTVPAFPEACPQAGPCVWGQVPLQEPLLPPAGHRCPCHCLPGNTSGNQLPSHCHPVGCDYTACHRVPFASLATNCLEHHGMCFVVF